MNKYQGNRFLAAVLVSLLLSACAGQQSNDTQTYYKKFNPGGVVSSKVYLEPINVAVGEVSLSSISELMTSSILRNSPLELTNIENIGQLYLLANRVEILSTYRRDGIGIKKEFSGAGGKYPGYRFRHVVVFENWEEVFKSFRGIEQAVLRKQGRETVIGIEIVRWQVDYVFVLSPDKRAFKVVLANAKYLDHMRVTDDDPRDNREPFYGAVTYRFPEMSNAQVVTSSVIFKLFDQTQGRRVYFGQQQSSGWLPLQKNSIDGPYNLYFTMVYASNSGSLMDSFTLDKLILRIVGG